MDRPYPLPVAIGALINENKILLIKRKSGNFSGLWALPGGKVEKEEYVSEAVVREIKEESGIDADFEEHLGIVSEHLVEDGRTTNHFLLHLCKLNPRNFEITEDGEGKLDWIDLSKIEEMKSNIIPSDYQMIKDLVVGNGIKKGYWESRIEKNGEGHKLTKFE